jgi:hypothetical protein
MDNPTEDGGNPNLRAESHDRFTGHKLDLSLPETLTRPLWKSLASNVHDRYFSEKLPPLQISSRPIDVGMLVGDIVSLPWYRTVFTNLGNVITPETLPPLELESRPVDVGELISDQMGHYWWSSLLRNLADQVAPERLPALQLTSVPVVSNVPPGPIQLVRWSSLITLPKVPVAERQRQVIDPIRGAAALPLRTAMAGAPSVRTASILVDPSRADPRAAQAAHGTKLKTKLSRSRLRESVFIGVAVIEGIYLLASFFGLV